MKYGWTAESKRQLLQSLWQKRINEPTNANDILICTRGVGNIPIIEKGYFKDEYWYDQYGNRFDASNVSHWMPMPAAPEE